VRGLQSTPCQLLLLVDESDPVSRVWTMMSVEARERVLRVLAGVIERVVSVEEVSGDQQD